MDNKPTLWQRIKSWFTPQHIIEYYKALKDIIEIIKELKKTIAELKEQNSELVNISTEVRRLESQNKSKLALLETKLNNVGTSISKLSETRVSTGVEPVKKTTRTRTKKD